MNELSKGEIEKVLTDHSFQERKDELCEEIEAGTVIRGCDFSLKLSSLYREVILATLELLDLPKDVLVVETGSLARDQITLPSDADLALFVPGPGPEHAECTGKFLPTMMGLFHHMGISGNPEIWDAKDIGKKRTDWTNHKTQDILMDRVRIVSMCNDMRSLFERPSLTVSEIQERTRKACPPLYVASMHERELTKMHGSAKEKEQVIFNIKDGPGGLRTLQHILWFLEALTHKESQVLYASVFEKNPEVKAALNLFLHLRSLLSVQKKKSGENADLITGEDWAGLRKRFGGDGDDDIIYRIHRSRIAISNLALTSLYHAKKSGLVINGVRYGISGLTLNFQGKMDPEQIVRLLIESQITGLPISPGAIDYLLGDGKKFLDGPPPSLGNLVLEDGNFSQTLETLEQLDLTQKVIPGLNRLYVQQFEDCGYRHGHLHKGGRVKERNERLEQIVQSEPLLELAYHNLSPDKLGGLRFAISCLDIPVTNRTTSTAEEKVANLELYRRYFDTQLRQRFPQLGGVIEVALYLLEKHKILFDCALIDDWNEKSELSRIAGEIGSLQYLNLLFVYTCGILDYQQDGYFPRYLWRKTFGLYAALRDHFSGGKYKTNKIIELKHSIDEKPKRLLERMPESLHFCQHIGDNAQFIRTLGFLGKVQNTGKPSVTVKRIDTNTFQIIVTAVNNTKHFPAKIAQMCFENSASIDDAEIYPIPVKEKDGNEKPLIIAFYEAHIPDHGAIEQDMVAVKQLIEKGLGNSILADEAPAVDRKKIFTRAKPKFKLERTKATGKHKLIVEATQDVPGFLLAILSIIASSEVTISQMGVLTTPRRENNRIPVRDSFILGNENIEVLRKLLQEEFGQ